ncbi:DUF3742 family protein [Bordetella sp. 2513F-2]
MKHTAGMTTAARLGRWLGSVWRGWLRAERRVHRWLMAQGLPAGGVAVLILGGQAGDPWGVAVHRGLGGAVAGRSRRGSQDGGASAARRR